MRSVYPSFTLNTMRLFSSNSRPLNLRRAIVGHTRKLLAGAMIDRAMWHYISWIGPIRGMLHHSLSRRKVVGLVCDI